MELLSNRTRALVSGLQAVAFHFLQPQGEALGVRVLQSSGGFWLLLGVLGFFWGALGGFRSFGVLGFRGFGVSGLGGLRVFFGVGGWQRGEGREED